MEQEEKIPFSLAVEEAFPKEEDEYYWNVELPYQEIMENRSFEAYQSNAN